MGKQLNSEEQLIQFFINKFNEGNSVEVTISKKDLSELNLTEQEASRTILLLEKSHLLDIKRKSPHNDFSMFWTISLNTSCIHYFDIQKDSKIEKRNNWIQFWIPVVISIIALAVSIITA